MVALINGVSLDLFTPEAIKAFRDDETLTIAQRLACAERLGYRQGWSDGFIKGMHDQFEADQAAMRKTRTDER